MRLENEGFATTARNGKACACSCDLCVPRLPRGTHLRFASLACIVRFFPEMMSLGVYLVRGRAARLARQAHNLEVVGSNPTPASIFFRSKLELATLLQDLDCRLRAPALRTRRSGATQAWRFPCAYCGSSRNRVGRTRYYPDVNVLVNVNVPGGGVTLAEGIAWKAWLQSLSAKASRRDTLPGKHS
jgi:hypothetical protein